MSSLANFRHILMLFSSIEMMNKVTIIFDIYYALSHRSLRSCHRLPTSCQRIYGDNRNFVCVNLHSTIFIFIV